MFKHGCPWTNILFIIGKPPLFQQVITLQGSQTVMVSSSHILKVIKWGFFYKSTGPKETAKWRERWLHRAMSSHFKIKYTKVRPTQTQLWKLTDNLCWRKRAAVFLSPLLRCTHKKRSLVTGSLKLLQKRNQIAHLMHVSAHLHLNCNWKYHNLSALVRPALPLSAPPSVQN